MRNEEAITELSVLWERMKRAKESGVKTIMYYDGQYVEALDLAIKVLEQTRWIPAGENFFKWLALEIMQSDEDFKDNSEAFQEMCCRKLIKLGIIKKETEEGRIVYSLEDCTNE